MGNYTSWFAGSEKGQKVLLFGLDAAGKTTILYHLKLGKALPTIPTIGFNVEDFSMPKSTLRLWDIGLRSKTKALMRHYTPDAKGIIFVLDASFPARFDEAAELLDESLDLVAAPVPLLVLLNKSDLSEPDVTSFWEKVKSKALLDDRPVSLVPTSAHKNIDSARKGLVWLDKAIYQQSRKGASKPIVGWWG
eukprot:m.293710 g.293710  ORF g.293710 m.293710 type:complete len:192 (+) comp29313_c0_seq1:105-680(+)